MKLHRPMAFILFLTLACTARADDTQWKHSGVFFLLTTAEGAQLRDAAVLEDFPLLVRLHRDFFDFKQAAPDGSDLRFTTADAKPLAYQIEEWNPADGNASIWVRIPRIKGNDRQPITLRWGNAGAKGESSGSAVFNASNGYLSVWHMTAPLTDEVGTLASKDVATTASRGVIGAARHLAQDQGIFGGDKIPNYPAGAAPHTSQGWFRPQRPNVTLLGWGNEGGGRGTKVRMQLRSPPHIKIDSDFADVTGLRRVPLSEWIHVVHTYDGKEGRIYVNGRLDAAASPTLNIHTPERLWIGGWYNQYDFVGDIDEVRISAVARSPDWIQLEYENQKPLQTLVGPLVQPGDEFSVTPSQVTLNEGQTTTLTARAGGAQKLYWILKRDSREQVIATDRFTLPFDAGRVTGDQTLTLQLKAVFPTATRTIDIPVTVREAIPDPQFTLTAPATWDGRQTIEVVPQISNAREMRSAGADRLHYTWNASDNIAVIKETAAGKLLLKRAQNSGTLTVTATIDNGGAPVTRSVEIAVSEPTHDPWIIRAPARDEKPQENQFYARDDKDQGTLYYNGTLKDPADSVFLRVYADQQLYNQQTLPLPADRAYAFTVKLKPGLVVYKAVFGSVTGGRETVLDTVNNLVCGDAYLIDGQSNAEATSFGKQDYPFTSPWIRTFGAMDTSPQGARQKLWDNASARTRGGKAQIGYWGMELARRLVEEQKIPICIINGAVGGTRIDQHQRNNADPTDVTTIYGRLLWRVQQAHLTHGIRGVLWHQGENDQGADGPTGTFGYETYRQFFIDLAAGWKQDYPNIQHYYVFQIWPKSCAMGIDGSDNRLREVQRNLPTAFSNLSVMSTLGIDPPGGCHYPPEGYAEIARLICPLVQRDNYARHFPNPITPPNLKRAGYTTSKKDQVTLEFDQPVKWIDTLKTQFYLDGKTGVIASGLSSANTLTLQLTTPSTAGNITYLDSKSWSQSNLLRGENGLAALTFCEVPILPPKP